MHYSLKALIKEAAFIFLLSSRLLPSVWAATASELTCQICFTPQQTFKKAVNLTLV